MWYLLLCIGKINTEDVLDHINLQRSHQILPKYWIRYIEKHISTSLTRSEAYTKMISWMKFLDTKPEEFAAVAKIKVITCETHPYKPPVLLPTMILEAACKGASALLKTKVMLCKVPYKSIKVSEIVARPTFQLYTKSLLCMEVQNIDINWTFHLHKLHRLNVTFIEIKLRDVFGNW